MNNITLHDLERASKVLNIAKIAKLAGMHPTTLHHRVLRLAPELTAEESNAIRNALADAGLGVNAVEAQIRNSAAQSKQAFEHAMLELDKIKKSIGMP